MEQMPRENQITDCIQFLHHFWFYKPDDIDEEIGVIPFKLDKITTNEPSSFELIFYVNSTKYWYQLELDDKQVIRKNCFMQKCSTHALVS